jgi:AraC-like DNA-binding protein
MIFEQLSDQTADQLPYQRRRMFREERRFAFTPATAPRLTLRSAELGSSRLFRVSSTGHQIELFEAEHTTILLPRRGTIEVETAKCTFVARAGETLLFPPNLRATQVVPDKSGLYECDCLLVPTAAASDDGAAGRLRPHAVELAFSGNLAERHDAGLRGCINFLTTEGAKPDSSLRHAAVRRAASALVQELLGELVDRFDDDGERNCAASPRETRLVRAAEDFMRAHLDQPLSVAELAAQLGVSRRRLQYAFQHVRQASARTILGELRLQRARQQLADPAEGHTVAQIALDCGIAHFGRFAAAYAARYGELPSVTRLHAIRR